MTRSVNESMNDGGDCRTAPATPGLLNTVGLKKTILTKPPGTPSTKNISLFVHLSQSPAV